MSTPTQSERTYTTQDRYEVGCECCGVLCFETRKLDASQAAAGYTADGHRAVTVYDRMAHRGRGRMVAP